MDTLMHYWMSKLHGSWDIDMKLLTFLLCNLLNFHAPPFQECTMPVFATFQLRTNLANAVKFTVAIGNRNLTLLHIFFVQLIQVTNGIAINRPFSGFKILKVTQ